MNKKSVKKIFRYLLQFLLLTFMVGTLVNIITTIIHGFLHPVVPVASWFAVFLASPTTANALNRFNYLPSIIVQIPCVLVSILICIPFFACFRSVQKNENESAPTFLQFYLIIEALTLSLLLLLEKGNILFVAVHFILIILLFAYRKEYLDTDDE